MDEGLIWAYLRAPPPTIAVPSPAQIYFGKALPFKHFREMDVMTAQSAAYIKENDYDDLYNQRNERNRGV